MADRYLGVGQIQNLHAQSRQMPGLLWYEIESQLPGIHQLPIDECGRVFHDNLRDLARFNPSLGAHQSGRRIDDYVVTGSVIANAPVSSRLVTAPITAWPHIGS